MKIVVCLLIFLCSFFFKSFGQYLQDIHGRPYFITKYSEYQGSPFLFDDWKTANIITAKDNRIEKVLLNVDAYGTPFYLTETIPFIFLLTKLKSLLSMKAQQITFLKKVGPYIRFFQMFLCGYLALNLF